ncbi:MAG TPA: GDP-mannose 4,6-dehydratase [Candidatus Paceibacterota bacterium]
MIRRQKQIKNILITGGAGFIGINASEYFIRKGYQVIIFDDFSRAGASVNLKWLGKKYPKKFNVVRASTVNDFPKLVHEVGKNDVVLHLAAQVAVTTSVTNPRDDFERNALGTFNVLEAVRLSKRKPLLIYSSTNKVYGGLENLGVAEKKIRYTFKNLPLGVSESQPLDFHSPYGCSKGSADQYVRDYSRIYNLDTAVFRQSCIYGPHQFGIEDQGWVAWFIIATNLGKQITIYGNGKQVRDVLFVDDLCRAYELVILKRKKVSGQIFNIGGGPSNTLSLLEFMPMLGPVKYKFSKTRPGDQPIFISDISKARKMLGWQPKVGVREGIKRITEWVKANKKEF